VHSDKGKGKMIFETSSVEINSQMPSPGTLVELIKQKISPSTGPWSKSFLDKAEAVKQATVLEDPAKRRSKRVILQKNGFKNPKCTSKNCLGCTVSPPALSPSVIRNLGSTFCKMEEATLTETALLQKKKGSL